MRDRSSVMPPRTGVTWPSSEVPAPQATTGTRVGVAERQEAGGFVGGLDERDGVGQDGRLGVLAVRMVLAQGGVGGDAVAQEVAGGGDHGIGGLGHRWTLRGLCAGLRQGGRGGKARGLRKAG